MTAASESSPTFWNSNPPLTASPCVSWSTILVNHSVLFALLFTADSGVSSAMQLDDFSNQQNGNYQPHPEPVSAIRLIYSPPSLAEPQLPQGLGQHLPAPASDGSYIQVSTQLPEGIHQQTAARLHSGAYQHAEAHRQPYQSQTVSPTFLIFHWQLFIYSQFHILVTFFLENNDFVILISDQHHYSHHLLGHLTKSPAFVRHGSASLVEMLKSGKPPQAETRNPSSSPGLLQDVQNATGDPSCPFCSSHQNPFLCSALLQSQGFSRDSTRRFASPPRPVILQRPTELCLSAPNSPRSQQHCESCRSVLVNDAEKTGRPRGNTCIPDFSTSSQFASVSKPHFPTSPHLATSPPPQHFPSTSPTSKTQMDLMFSPPSQAQSLWSLYKCSDLTLLNQRLHRIINLRNSSPNLSAYNPVKSQRDSGGSASTLLDNRDRSHSLNVPLFFSPSQDRCSLPLYDIEGRPSPLVG